MDLFEDETKLPDNIPDDVRRYCEAECIGVVNVELDQKVQALMQEDHRLDYEDALCRLTGGTRISEPVLVDRRIQEG